MFYHGTNQKFNQFSKEFFGKGEGSNMLGNGVYLAKTKSKAKIYGKIILKVTLKKDIKLIDYDQIKYEKNYNRIFNIVAKKNKKLGFDSFYDDGAIDPKEYFARKYYDGYSYASQVIVFEPNNCIILN